MSQTDESIPEIRELETYVQGLPEEIRFAAYEFARKWLEYGWKNGVLDMCKKPNNEMKIVEYIDQKLRAMKV